MEYTKLKKVVILGIGGKGAYYIVKFLLLLGVKVQGFDIKKSERTEALEELGAVIEYRNPNEGEKFNCDLYIYSSDLPVALQEKIFLSNQDIQKCEVGELYYQLVNDFEHGKLNQIEKKAFTKSDIAPLFNIDQSKMRYISVTGTDGKTSTCSMIYHILKNEGFKVALITTVAGYVGDEQIDTGFHTTTPSAQELYRLIKMAEEKNCTHIVIESTSHGLEQGRLAGIKFDNIGYTNITTEHLDYHKTWENYAKAKGLLITEHLKESGGVTLNLDDKSFTFLSKLAKEYSTYSIQTKADFFADGIEEKTDSIEFDVNNLKCVLPIIGRFNVSNFLCAASICDKEGISLEKSIASMETFFPVVGRMNILQHKPFVVIVDFAHTSNSTKVALESARKLVGDSGRLIHVFGCAGQRDVSKRAVMGKISNMLADITILTAEDPRQESLKDINDEIEGGWLSGGNENAEFIRFDDDQKNVKVRKDAINKAFDIANEDDVIIITGKAHEQSLCFGNVEYPWDDIEEVNNLINGIED